MVLEINKIHLGNSYELIKQIPDKSIDCIYTDIPYLYESGGFGSSELAKRIEKTKQSIKDAKIYNGIDYAIFEEFIRISKNINIFIWCSRLQLFEIMQFFIPKGYLYQILTWNKTNPTPSTNNSWLPDIEYCLHFRGDGSKLNDGYEFKSKWYVSGLNVNDKKEFDHPTIKPLNLVKRHLLHATQQNDVVLDCFSGSGTTCVACKEIGRQFIGIEIDSNYHKISLDRLNGINTKGQTSIFTDFNNL